MKDSEYEIETHPWEPFFPENAKILMLGSFPPKPERWKMDFYYPNFQNDMWRILGLVFFGDKNHFLLSDGKAFNEEGIRFFLSERGIALSDTGREVIRLKGNASDKFLEIIKPIDMEVALRQLPCCKSIVTTGQKATDTLLTLIDVTEPKMGAYSEFVYLGRSMRFYRMPSSSRAYPKPIEEKAEIYRQMFRDLGVL